MQNEQEFPSYGELVSIAADHYTHIKELEEKYSQKCEICWGSGTSVNEFSDGHTTAGKCLRCNGTGRIWIDIEAERKRIANAVRELITMGEVVDDFAALVPPTGLAVLKLAERIENGEYTAQKEN